MKNIFTYFVIVLCFLCFCRSVRAEEAENGGGQDVVALQQKIDADVYALLLQQGYVTRSEVKLYKNIFRALQEGNIEEAESLSEDLDGDVLLGHILAEKYLSKKYVSTYDELKKWLTNYPDYPQAQRIYNLALKKAGKDVQTKDELPNPKLLTLDVYNRRLYARDMEAYENLSAENKKLVRKNVTLFYRYLRLGKTLKAKRVLESKKFRMAIPDEYWDEMSAALAQEYFLDNHDKLAVEWSVKPMRRSHNATAYWIAGLASWRQKKITAAADYFSKLGASSGNDEWLESAGAYWAYRCYKRLGQNKNAEKQLETAAKYQRTFYGILAAYVLGKDITYNWTGTPYWNDFSDASYAENLAASTAIRRAVVLFHAKRPDIAERELSYAYENMNEKQKEAVLFLLNHNGRHSVAIKLANKLYDQEKGIAYDNFAYPVPNFVSDDLCKDKALILAVTRQESGFNPEAKSSAGACGLMQVMPNTAYHITKDKKDKKDRSRLFDIAHNVEIGQKYLEYLLSKPFISGNLLYMLAAYNAGPGNLSKWLKEMRFDGDPLMFMEVVPARQTRLYIERVMANYWIYSMQLDLPGGEQTVKEIAEGHFPTL